MNLPSTPPAADEAEEEGEAKRYQNETQYKQNLCETNGRKNRFTPSGPACARISGLCHAHRDDLPLQATMIYRSPMIERAMTKRWISLVPSPIVIRRVSR